mmetsp:Transcript_27120/g.50193  ORF Transcript_27120/g.50193 Transcript_27120/m.50193 type:complete len:81 (+) Transcript_27120:522-764(+)
MWGPGLARWTRRIGILGDACLRGRKGEREKCETEVEEKITRWMKRSGAPEQGPKKPWPPEAQVEPGIPFPRALLVEAEAS